MINKHTQRKQKLGLKLLLLTNQELVVFEQFYILWFYRCVRLNKIYLTISMFLRLNTEQFQISQIFLSSLLDF